MVRSSSILLSLFAVVLTMAVVYFPKLFEIQYVTNHFTEVQSTNNTDINFSMQKRNGFPTSLPAFPNVVIHLKRWLDEEFLSWKSSFYDTLLELADERKMIYLGLVDASYADMAYNMYVTSFNRFDISNFLFVCGDR